MNTFEFLDFAHSQQENIYNSLHYFADKIFDKNFKLQDFGYYDENGIYHKNLKFVQK